MVGLGEFALDLITELVKSVLKEGVNYSSLSFFEQRKIERRVEDAIAEVVEPLIPFLSREGISEDKQRRLIETCIDELRPLTRNPGRLFQGSLNGQKIFEDLYANRDLPQVVVEDGLKDTYSLLCPRIATLLCKIPAAVKDWENEAWSENYRRLEEITAQMRSLFIAVDTIATLPSKEADEMLAIVRRTLAQKIRLDMDLTGLRADRPLAEKFDDFFVHPEFKEIVKDEKQKAKVVGTPNECFAQFARKKCKTILVGPPGAGKSTWAKWLQRETLGPQWTGIAIRVELRRFSTEPLLSLHELIREAAGKHLAEELTASRISKWLDSGQVVFIIDGFDEIRPSERDNVLNWIVELDAATRGCPFILTSRPLTTNHLDRLSVNWQRWSVEPFDEPRIVDYIQRWYAHTPLILESKREINAIDLARRWGGDPPIGPLTGNPLLLSTLLMVHHLDGSLPGGRSYLYRRYVEGMLGLWDDRRRVTATGVTLSLEQKRQIMRGFALHIFLAGQDQLDELPALVWLQEYLRKMAISTSAIDVLDAIRERSGLIIGPGIYSFAHKSVAEYLVAESALQGDQRDSSGKRIDRFCLFEHRDDDQWNTVIFLWAGLAPVTDVESFIDACLEAEAFDLAYGVLYDQYDRITVEIRRRLLLKTICSEQKPYTKRSNYWVSPGPAAVIEISIPDFRLRGLSQHGQFWDRLLRRAISDGAIVWSDYAKARGESRNLLHMIFATMPIDIETWKACLRSPFYETSSIQWFFLVADWVLGRALTQPNNSIALEALVQAYQEACPQVQGLMPIALMSNVLVMILIKEERQQLPVPSEYVARVLGILISGDANEVIPDWLLGTQEWTIPWVGSSPKHSVDLLVDFRELLVKLVGQDSLTRDVKYERAISFVRDLEERRTTLQLQNPSHYPKLRPLQRKKNK